MGGGTILSGLLSHVIIGSIYKPESELSQCELSDEERDFLRKLLGLVLSVGLITSGAESNLSGLIP